MSTSRETHGHRTLPAALALVCAATLAGAGSNAPAAAAHPAAEGQRAPHRATTLDLGPPNLPERRTTRTLQRGVTLTRITRGVRDRSLRWTAEVLLPAGEGSPDPDAPPTALSDRATARAQARRAARRRLRRPGRAGPRTTDRGCRGADPRLPRAGRKLRGARPTRTPRRPDWSPRARALRPSTPAGTAARRTAAPGGSRCSRSTRSGSAAASRRRTDRTCTTARPPRELARAFGATAAVNAGFFVLDPAAGAPGRSGGRRCLRREGAVGGGRRPARAGRPRRRPPLGRSAGCGGAAWRSSTAYARRSTASTGCRTSSATAAATPTDAPDPPTPSTTSRAPTTPSWWRSLPEYAAATPQGDGREVVVEDGRVTAVSDSRGVALLPGSRRVQATGDAVDQLADVTVGRRAARSGLDC